MIIYGSRNIQLAKETITDKCPSCSTHNSVELIVFQKYAHVFWIPFFPMGKTAVSQCSHCRQVLKNKEMPEAFKSSYDVLKAQNKTPIWTFAGLGLLVVLISWGVIHDKQNDEKNAKLIAAPKSGDIFEIKTAGNQYTLFKVDHLNGDTAFVRLHQYESNKISGLTDLKQKGDAAYTEETLPYTLTELKEMLNKGEIHDIDRN